MTQVIAVLALVALLFLNSYWLMTAGWGIEVKSWRVLIISTLIGLFAVRRTRHRHEIGVKHRGVR